MAFLCEPLWAGLASILERQPELAKNGNKKGSARTRPGASRQPKGKKRAK